MSKPYVSPVINKLQSGMMSKFGNNPLHDRRVRENIAGVSVAELAERFGSPLFVYSEQAIREQYQTIESAFSTRYSNVCFGWSYKTNYLSAICAVMHGQGAIAEVVSQMEYDKARALGVPGQQIMFNGPHKSTAALKRAVADGALINIDHLDELADLERLAEESGRTLDVGLRLNLDAGIVPQWSRFGFNLESGQAMDAVKRLAAKGRLRLTGLHCHIGTYILDPAAYARQIEKMVGFGYEVDEAFGFEMQYIDIGGGLPSQSKLKGTYLPPDVAVPAVDEYAEQIGDALTRALRPGHYPRLIIEAGRAMIDEAGYLISSIVASKRLPNGTRAYVADAGVNLLFTSFWYKFRVEMDRPVTGTNETSVIYGPMCMNIDVLDEGVLLPPLGRGDRLIFSPVGAYNNTQWLQFIEYRPNVVLIGGDGQVDVIRQAEDLTDIERRERLPKRLEVSAAHV